MQLSGASVMLYLTDPLCVSSAVDEKTHEDLQRSFSDNRDVRVLRRQRPTKCQFCDTNSACHKELNGTCSVNSISAAKTVVRCLQLWTVYKSMHAFTRLSKLFVVKWRSCLSSRTWSFMRSFCSEPSQKDSRVLVGLLTGHADLNWHLHIMGLHQDSVYPLCQEEEDTTAHFIAQCSALMLLQKNILGDYILLSATLHSIHWFLLLKFAKVSKWFYWPSGLSGLHIGPVLWPQHWVSAHAGIHPSGKVR